MKGVKRRKCKLTDRQQEVVIAYYSMTRGIAHIIWRTASLPARFLEDMYQEGLYRLCVTVMHYEGKEAKWSLEEIIKFTVNKHLWKMVKQARDKVPEPMDYWVREEMSLYIESTLSQEESNKIDDVVNAVSKLKYAQRQVFERRYGMYGDPPMSQLEVAKKLKTVQSNVHRAEHRAISRIREILGVENAAS